MARILRDTHAAVWWWLGSPNLGKVALQALDAGWDDIVVRAISALKIATDTVSASSTTLAIPKYGSRH